MAKPKYSLKTRLAVVNHYLAGHDGARCTAERFGVEENISYSSKLLPNVTKRAQ